MTLQSLKKNIKDGLSLFVGKDYFRKKEDTRGLKTKAVTQPLILSPETPFFHELLEFRWEYKGSLAGVSFGINLKNQQTNKLTSFRGIKGKEFKVVKRLPPGKYKYWVIAKKGKDSVFSLPQEITICEDAPTFAEKKNFFIQSRERARIENDAFLRHGRSLTYQSNLELKAREIEEGITKLRSFPEYISINVGYNCNIDCVMCDNGRVYRPQKFPSSFIDELEHYLPLARHVTISGGEPLIYPESARLFDYVKNYPHVGISVDTNGILIDDAWIARLTNGGPHSISLSYDGITEGTYSKIRRKSNFTKLMETTKRLSEARKNGLPFMLASFTVMKSNYHEIIPFMQFALKHGFTTVTFRMMVTDALEAEYIQREDCLPDKEVCRSILRDIRSCEAIARKRNISFPQRIYGYIIPKYPDLALYEEEYAHLPAAQRRIRENEIEPLGSFTDPQILDALLKGEDFPELPSENGATARRSSFAAFPEGLSATPPQNDFFCLYPFQTLGLHLESSYVCCYSTRDFYFMPYKPGWNAIHDVWNSGMMQKAREHMLKGRQEALCTPTCPYWASKGYREAWVRWP